MIKLTKIKVESNLCEGCYFWEGLKCNLYETRRLNKHNENTCVDEENNQNYIFKSIDFKELFNKL